MFSKSRLWLLLSLLLLAALPSAASTIRRVDLGTMVDEAELIFVGTVISSESVPTRDGSYAFTYVTFDIEHTLKGISRGGKTITLRMAGGRSGSDVFEVSGAPVFEAGGRHLLFVQGNDRDGVPLSGWSQGKLDIRLHPVSGQAMFVDENGRAVDGIRGNAWYRGGLKLNRDGSLRQPEPAGVEVVSENGLRIELPKPEPFVDHAAPVESVLGELRAFIAQRKGASRGYRDSQFVDSASKANVPATFVHTPARAK